MDPQPGVFLADVEHVAAAERNGVEAELAGEAEHHLGALVVTCDREERLPVAETAVTVAGTGPVWAS